MASQQPRRSASPLDSEERASPPSVASVYSEAIRAATQLDDCLLPSISHRNHGDNETMAQQSNIDASVLLPYCKISLLAKPALDVAPAKFPWQIEDLLLLSHCTEPHSRHQCRAMNNLHSARLEALWLPTRFQLPAPTVRPGACVNVVASSLPSTSDNTQRDFVSESEWLMPHLPPTQLAALGGKGLLGEESLRLLITLDLGAQEPYWRRTATLHRGRELAAVAQVPSVDGSLCQLIALGGCCTGSSVEVILPESGNCRTAARLLDSRFSAAAAVVVFEPGLHSTGSPKLRWGFVVVFGGRNSANRGEVLRTTERLDLHAIDPTNFAPAAEGLRDLESRHSSLSSLPAPPPPPPQESGLISNGSSSLANTRVPAMSTDGAPASLEQQSGRDPGTVSLASALAETGAAQISRWCLRETESASTNLLSSPPTDSVSEEALSPVRSVPTTDLATTGSGPSTVYRWRSTTQDSGCELVAKWEALKPLGQARFECTAVTIPSTAWIIVVGGNSGAKLLASTELLNPVTNVSTTGPLMCHARCRPAVVITSDGVVVVYGGIGPSGATVDSVEVWDAAPFIGGERPTTLDRFLEVSVTSVAKLPDQLFSSLVERATVDSGATRATSQAVATPSSASTGSHLGSPSPNKGATESPKFHTVVSSKLSSHFEPRQAHFETLASQSWTVDLHGRTASEARNTSLRDSGPMDSTHWTHEHPCLKADSLSSTSEFLGGKTSLKRATASRSFLRSSTAPIPSRKLSSVTTTGRAEAASCEIPQAIIRASLHSKFVEKLKRRGSWGNSNRSNRSTAQPLPLYSEQSSSFHGLSLGRSSR